MSPLHHQIDLALAINYIPAATCMLRLVFFIFLMTLIHPGEELGGYSIIGLLVWQDRVVFRTFLPNPIFDGNALVLAVFASNLFLIVRNSNTGSHLSFMGAVVNFWWGMMCVGMILEPIYMRRVFERRKKLYHILPVIITGVALLALAQVHADREDAGVKFTRGICFALLSLVWIYVVALHQVEQASKDSSAVVSRFSPVLYMPVPLACLFALIAAGCIGYQYYLTFLCVERYDEHSKKETPILTSLKIEETPVVPKDQEFETLEEIFKQAKRGTELAR